MYKYILTVEADDDLSNIYKFTAENWGEDQAIRYLAQLQESILKLCENPRIARQRKDLGNEMYSFPISQHVVYFNLSDEQLIIWAIHHKNRLPYYELDLYQD